MKNENDKEENKGNEIRNRTDGIESEIEEGKEKSEIGKPKRQGSTKAEVNGEANPFARGGLQRSPARKNPSRPQGDSTLRTPIAEGKAKPGLGGGTPATPATGTPRTQPELDPKLSKFEHALILMGALCDLISEKQNVHREIKSLALWAKCTLGAADQELKESRLKAEETENRLKLELEGALNSRAPPTPRQSTGKRDRDAAGVREIPRKAKRLKTATGGDDKPDKNGWQIVNNRKAQRKLLLGNRLEQNLKEKAQKGLVPPTGGEKRKTRKRGDALVVQASSASSYADILKRVKSDPKLKSLGENVVRTRRTQKGELLFELKRDLEGNSESLREALGESLGEGAKVLALSQSTAIECRYMDEITSEDDLREALATQFKLECAATMTIRMRKTYGGTQAATIRLPQSCADRVLRSGKVRVGWSVCPLRVSQLRMRCFRCQGFDHVAKGCTGEDRSDLCRRCGEKGHFARDCKKAPKCILCPAGSGNSHFTGGKGCPASRKLVSGQP